MPALRADVPDWLARRYGVQLDQVVGLPEALRAADEYTYHRGAPELRAQILGASTPEIAGLKYRQALEAELAATKALTPAARTERLVRFLVTLRRHNRWQVPDLPAPAGADLPLLALLALAFWAGYRSRAPAENSVRASERLLRRRS